MSVSTSRSATAPRVARRCLGGGIGAERGCERGRGVGVVPEVLIKGSPDQLGHRHPLGFGDAIDRAPAGPRSGRSGSESLTYSKYIQHSSDWQARQKARRRHPPGCGTGWPTGGRTRPADGPLIWVPRREEPVNLRGRRASRAPSGLRRPAPWTDRHLRDLRRGPQRDHVRAAEDPSWPADRPAAQHDHRGAQRPSPDRRRREPERDRRPCWSHLGFDRPRPVRTPHAGFRGQGERRPRRARPRLFVRSERAISARWNRESSPTRWRCRRMTCGNRWAMRDSNPRPSAV